MANTHALDLERGSSQYASITNASQTGLDITGDITIEAWIKFESFPSTTGDDFTIASKWLLTGDQRSYWLNVDSGDNSLRFLYSEDGLFTNITELSTTVGIVNANELDQWIHVAVAVDVSARTMSAYRNGVALGTSDQGGTHTSIYNSTAEFVVGSRDDNADWFDGRIDDLRVWSGIRTQAEIKANMGKELTGGETGLAGYWKFNNDLTDETSNGNDLTGSGSPTYVTSVPFDKLCMFELEREADTTDGTSFVTDTIEPTIGRTLIVSVASASSGTASVPTVTGLATTWTQVNTGTAASRRMTVFSGVATSSSGTITFDFGANTQLRAMWSVSEVFNTNVEVVQSSEDSREAGIGAITTWSTTLGSFSASDNLTYGTYHNSGQTTVTAGSGFTQLDLATVDAQVIQAQMKASSDTSVDWTFASNNSAFIAIGLELGISSSSMMVF